MIDKDYLIGTDFQILALNSELYIGYQNSLLKEEYLWYSAQQKRLDREDDDCL